VELSDCVNRDPLFVYDPDTSFEGWVGRFSGSVRERLSVTRNEIFSARGDYPWLNRRDMEMAAFIKVERMPCSYIYDFHLDRKPRLIQGRSDAAKVIMGPWFWTASKAMARLLDSNSDVFYCSGSSAEELGAWASEAETMGLIPLCFDLELYDGSIGTAPLGAWATCCEAMKAPKDLRALMGLRGSVQKGKTKNGLKYSRLGQVSSGDGDTTLGNSTILAVAWRHVLKKCGLKRNEYRVCLLGDDSVVAIQPNKRARVTAVAHRVFNKLGFRLTQDVSGDWDTATFCSVFFWRTVDGRVFGPNPGRVLSKTFWSVTKRRPFKQKAWLRGLVDSLRLTTKYVPLLRVLVARLESLLGDGPVIREAFRDRDRLRAVGSHTSIEAELQYAAILGCDVIDIQAAEFELSHISSADVVLKGSFWEHVLTSVSKGAN